MAKLQNNQSIKGLQEELSRMADLFENTRINYQLLDGQGIIRHANKSWLECLGYKKDEVVGKSFDRFLSLESGSVFNKNIRNFIKLDSREELELMLCCSDGSEINTSFSCFGKRDEKGELLNIHCVFQNISRLRTVEEALKISEDKYERIFNSFLDVYYQTDENSIITLISPSVRKTGRYDPDELIGRHVGDFFIDEEDRMKIRELLFEQGYVDDYDLSLRTKDGNLIDVSINAHLIRDEQGVIKNIEGVIRDISRRKKFELEIASYNNRLKEITDGLPAVLFQLSQNDQRIDISYISPNVKEKLGISADKIIKDPISVLKSTSINDRERIKNELVNALRDKRVAEIECEVTFKDGDKRWVRTKVSPRKSGSNEIIWTGLSTDITNEVMMKNKVREQEERLMAIFEFTNVGIATISLDRVVTSINPAICQISGYSENQIIGKHLKDVAGFYRKDLSFYMKLFADALAGKIPEERIVFEWKHKSGENRWAEVYLDLFKDKDKIKGFQCVLMDATHRILLQQAEKNKQNDIEFLFDSAVKLLMIDSEEEIFQFLTMQLVKLVPGAIINVNSVNEETTHLRVEAVTGITGKIRSMILKLFDQQLSGRTFAIDKNTFSYAKHGKLLINNDNLYDLMLHQVPVNICRQIEKIIQLNEIYELSIGIGEKIMGGCAIFLKKGQTIKNTSLIETLFRQVSQALSRLRTHSQLTMREELYRSLAENAQDLIVRVDENIKPIYANQAFLKTFNLKLDQVLHREFCELGFPVPICDLISQTINQTFISRQSQTCDNVINLDDAPNFFEWRMFPEYDEKKHIQSVLMFIRNITIRKNIEAKIQDSIVNKNKIYSLISHDLRNPFNSILGFLEFLKRDFHLMSDELKLKYINVISESSQNFFELLNSLQEWSQGFEQDRNINPVFFDLQQLINSTLDVYKLQILEKELVINSSIPTGVIVKADYNMIYTSIRNIISNACKFSLKGGEIDIGLRKQRKEVLIEIRDYGIGMSDEEMRKLLNLEKRFTKPGTLGEKGSGLGFILTKELIELNNGRLIVNSQPGKGCAVTIVLKTH